MSKELITTSANTPAFADAQGFELAQRVAKALASSDLVPKEYKNNVSNCLVAIEYSHRVKMSVLAVMQHLNIIHGKPSPSSAFIIAAINTCGRFKPLRYKMLGSGDGRGCIAWTTDETGEVLESPLVSIAMAKSEGWFQKSGSKWQTMPELMLRYRAASFFGRLYAPEILMGMHTSEEQNDIIQSDVAMDTLNARIRAGQHLSHQDIETIEPVEEIANANDTDKK